MPLPRTAQVPDEDPDISLPFDEAPAPAAAAPPPNPAYASPPAWKAPPAAAPLPPATPLPAATTCPQCLSGISPDDVFCGVCGYRLK